MDQPVICFDIDGTLVNERGEIHPRDVAILAQPNPPALFVPCTGRLRPALHNLFTRQGICPDGSLPFPLVLQNGAALYGPGEALVRFHSFSELIQHFVLDLVMGTPEVTFLVFSEDQVYIQWPTEFAYGLARRFDLDTRPFDLNEPIRFSKVMAFCEDPEYLAVVAKQVDRADIEQSFSLATVLEMTPAGVHKGRGLRELLQLLGRWGYPLLAAGDGGNDISMFDLADRTFAPQTAPASMQALAGKVIDVNETGLLEPMLAEAAGL